MSVIDNPRPRELMQGYRLAKEYHRTSIILGAYELEEENLPNDHASGDISFVSISPDNVEVLRELNGKLFPIKYTKRFYDAVVTPELSKFCKLVYLDGEPAGTVTCRVIEEGDDIKLYLMTMGVLESYRSQKVGSKTIEHIIDVARTNEEPKIDRILLHVWLLNPDGKRFYERNGFKEIGVEVEFYKADIDVRDAWTLELKLHPSSTDGVNGANGVKSANSVSGVNGVNGEANGVSKQQNASAS